MTESSPNARIYIFPVFNRLTSEFRIQAFSSEKGRMAGCQKIKEFIDDTFSRFDATPDYDERTEITRQHTHLHSSLRGVARVKLALLIGLFYSPGSTLTDV